MKLSKYTAVQIGRFDISAEGVPASVRAMLYEDVIAQLRASGYFGQVLRVGEKPEKPMANLATLNVSIQSFAKGSSRLREVTVISGRPHLFRDTSNHRAVGKRYHRSHTQCRSDRPR